MRERMPSCERRARGGEGARATRPTSVPASDVHRVPLHHPPVLPLTQVVVHQMLDPSASPARRSSLALRLLRPSLSAFGGAMDSHEPRPTFPPSGSSKRYSSSADLYSMPDSPLVSPQQLPTSTVDYEEEPSSWRTSYADFKPHRGSARYSQAASTLMSYVPSPGVLIEPEGRES